MQGSLIREFAADNGIPVLFPPNDQILKPFVAYMTLDPNLVFVN
jgi:hypothetical protein